MAATDFVDYSPATPIRAAWLNDADALVYDVFNAAATVTAARTALAMTDVSASEYGVAGNGTTDDTTALQNALNAAAGKTLRIPKPSSFYLISDDLLPSSNTVIVLEPGTLIKTAAGTFGTGEAVFKLDKKDRVTIYGNGATLQGLREGSGASIISFGVSMTGSTNIRIYDLRCIDHSGDGFYVAESDDNTVGYCENVWLERCVANNNMRQGLSLLGAKHARFVDCIFSGTNGKAPERGVDIEPSGILNSIIDVQFIRCVGSGNATAQFGSDLNGISNDVTMKFVDCIALDGTANGAIGFEISNHFVNLSTEGSIALENCVAKNMDSYGLLIRNIDRTGCPVFVKDFKSIETNKQQRTTYGGNAPVSIYAANNAVSFPNPGNIRIDGLSVVDTTADRTPLYLSSAGTAWTDVVIRRLDWKNTVGKTSFPYMDDATTSTYVEFIPEPYRINRTSNLTLSARYSGWVMSNVGAAALVIYTLPAVAVGLRFVFEVMDADGIRIVPNASDRLNPVASADAKYMESTTIGSSCVVFANQSGTDWVVQRFGTWTDEP